MTRKGKIVLGVALGAGALLFAGWTAFRPKFGTAPMAELEKLIDPRLLEESKPDPAGEARWKRYVEALKQVKGTPGTNASLAEGERFIKANQAAISNLQSVLDEGPLYHRTSILAMGQDFPMFTQLKNIAKASSFSAQDRASRGDYKGAIDSLEISFRLLKKVRASENTVIDDLVNIAIESILYAAAARIVRQPALPEAQARRLLALIPPAPKQDADLARAIRGEFQGYVLPWLDDPKTKFSKINTTAMIWGGITDSEPKDQGIFGNYNPYRTTEAANKIYLALLKSTGATISTIDTSGDKIKDQFEKDLPEGPDMTKTGWRADAETMWFKVQMNNIGNSFGKQMMLNTLGPTTLLTASFRIRTHRELIRTLTAIEIYRKGRGSPPASLSNLVFERLLETEPNDFFADAPLRYDRSLGVLYSVGENRKDDGGLFAAEGRPTDPDYGYRIKP